MGRGRERSRKSFPSNEQRRHFFRNGTEEMAEAQADADAK
jgi:hypothetical protein